MLSYEPCCKVRGATMRRRAKAEAFNDWVFAIEKDEARRRNEARHQLSGGAGPALLQDGPPFAGQPVSGTML